MDNVTSDQKNLKNVYISTIGIKSIQLCYGSYPPGMYSTVSTSTQLFLYFGDGKPLQTKAPDTFDLSYCIFTGKAAGQVFLGLFEGQHAFLGLILQGAVTHTGDTDELTDGDVFRCKYSFHRTLS